MKSLCITFILMCLSSLFSLMNSSGVQLTGSNLPQVLESNEFVLVNFYADWCRFSKILQPIFDEAAGKVEEEFPQDGKIVLAKVDCDKETSIAAQFHVSKYPTIKMFRNGQLIKREYRGQRSVEAITEFVREQVKDPLTRVSSLDDLDNLDRKKRHIIGYFDTEDSDEFRLFFKTASTLRDDCQFHLAVGEIARPERVIGNKIVYRPPSEDDNDIPYTGIINSFDILKAWATDKCIPFVREITFENAEELTEEGLPFLILFHDPSDTETPEKFRKVVAKELLAEKNSINILTADGLKFSHPLYHLGKTNNDLPILAIDSFRHMYLWPKPPKDNLEKPGLVRQFIQDLHSGKLHREFHHGPDPTTQDKELEGTQPAASHLPAPAIPPQEIGGGGAATDTQLAPHDSSNHMHVQAQVEGDGTHIPKDNDDTDKPPVPTTPPESTFAKLAPSRNRYTILRDEL